MSIGLDETFRLDHKEQQDQVKTPGSVSSNHIALTQSVLVVPVGFGAKWAAAADFVRLAIMVRAREKSLIQEFLTHFFPQPGQLIQYLGVSGR